MVNTRTASDRLRSTNFRSWSMKTSLANTFAVVRLWQIQEFHLWQLNDRVYFVLLHGRMHMEISAKIRQDLTISSWTVFIASSRSIVGEFRDVEKIRRRKICTSRRNERMNDLAELGRNFLVHTVIDGCKTDAVKYECPKLSVLIITSALETNKEEGLSYYSLLLYSRRAPAWTLQFPRGKSPGYRTTQSSAATKQKSNYELFNHNNFNIRYWTGITTATDAGLALQLILAKGFKY